jgi:magnesium chelatase family protein
LLDRFDMLVEVSRPGDALFDRSAAAPRETSASIRERVCAARERKLRRQGVTNAELHDTVLEQTVHLADGDRALLQQAVRRWGLSARAYHRVLRVARTIADLEDCAEVATGHVSEALGYRLNDAELRAEAAAAPPSTPLRS